MFPHFHIDQLGNSLQNFQWIKVQHLVDTVYEGQLGSSEDGIQISAGIYFTVDSAGPAGYGLRDNHELIDLWGCEIAIYNDVLSK